MNSRKYYYDEKQDTLNIYFSKADKFYSEEIEDNIYVIRNEENNDIIGVEILYFSLQNKLWLSSILPVKIDFSEMHINSSKQYKLKAII